MIDLSWIIGVAIAVILAIISVKLWPIIKAFIPPCALAILNWFASVVVNAVESEFASGEGEQKREEAFRRIENVLLPMITFMERFGFTIDAERIYEAIQAAWKKLDLSQMQAGAKVPPALVDKNKGFV